MLPTMLTTTDCRCDTISFYECNCEATNDAFTDDDFRYALAVLKRKTWHKAMSL